MQERQTFDFKFDLIYSFNARPLKTNGKIRTRCQPSRSLNRQIPNINSKIPKHYITKRYCAGEPMILPKSTAIQCNSICISTESDSNNTWRQVSVLGDLWSNNSDTYQDKRDHNKTTYYTTPSLQMHPELYVKALQALSEKNKVLFT